jgi:6-pyruvoyl-tetrahydropterin synthase
VDFLCNELQPETNWVIDIGKALEILGQVLSQYNLKNLDEVFPNGELTTTEFMARQIHMDICEKLQGSGFKGDICVKLWESHKAWGSYTAPACAL